jgi:aryl-alcohol dehydrogenase-like predicted oxidoreductase
MQVPLPLRAHPHFQQPISPFGLGLMAMSGMYGPSDEQESIATIHQALDSGITFLDTGDFYGVGHNELLLREALKGRKRENVFISVKFGASRGPDGSWTGVDIRPVAMKNFLAYSLQRLGTDYVDLYQPARLDQTPVEDVVGGLADLVKAGYVRHIGLSEVGADALKKAHAVHPIAALQIEYSLVSRGIEAEILPTARKLGVAITAYGILSRGLLAGSLPKGPTDFRSYLPRFTGENAKSNEKLVSQLNEFARTRSITPSQAAIAWVASRGTDIIPLIGARRRDSLEESVQGAHVLLSEVDLAELERIVSPDAVAGTRYDAHQMVFLDSEKR